MFIPIYQLLDPYGSSRRVISYSQFPNSIFDFLIFLDFQQQPITKFPIISFFRFQVFQFPQWYLFSNLQSLDLFMNSTLLIHQFYCSIEVSHFRIPILHF